MPGVRLPMHYGFCILVHMFKDTLAEICTFTIVLLQRVKYIELVARPAWLG